MKKTLRFINLFSLIGLMISTVAVINSLAYEGLKSMRYFTNQSNLLVLIVFIIINLKLNDNKHFKYLAFITLISISITGIVFHLLLSDTLGNNTGIITSIHDLNNFQNLITHTISPIYYLLYYFIFIKESINIKEFFTGLIHPLMYFLIILILSPITNFYPYPFLDVSKNGLSGVLKFTLLIMLPLIVLFTLGLNYLKNVLDNKINREVLTNESWTFKLCFKSTDI